MYVCQGVGCACDLRTYLRIACHLLQRGARFRALLPPIADECAKLVRMKGWARDNALDIIGNAVVEEYSVLQMGKHSF